MLQAQNITGNTRAAQVQRAGIAALLWHEVMHTHGYYHSNDGSGATPADVAAQVRQVPHIYGACLMDIMVSNVDAGCGGTSCSAGYVPMITGFRSTRCGCSPDPFAAHSNIPGSAIAFDSSRTQQIAINSAGVAYLRDGVDVFVQTGTGFQALPNNGVGPAAQIIAGGQRVYKVSQANHLYMHNGAQWIDIGDAGSELVADDFGTVYRRDSGGVSQFRVGQTGWQNVGGAAGKLYAGGDRLYALSPNLSQIFKFTPGHGSSAGAWTAAGGAGFKFAVDVFGRVYGLAPDRSGVFRNRGGNQWESVGGAADDIEAGLRLFASNAGNTYQFFAGNSWVFAGSTPSGFAVGDNVLYGASQNGHTWQVFAE